MFKAVWYNKKLPDIGTKWFYLNFYTHNINCYQIFRDGDQKPKVEHIQTRAEYLLKSLPKLVSNSPVKSGRKKRKPDIRTYYEDESPKATKTKKKKSKKESSEITEWNEEIFAKVSIIYFSLPKLHLQYCKMINNTNDEEMQ